jgi:hypothetical protein
MKNKIGKTIETSFLEDPYSHKIATGLTLMAGSACLAVGFLVPMPEWEKIASVSFAGLNYALAGANFYAYKKQKKKELLEATISFARNYSAFVKEE